MEPVLPLSIVISVIGGAAAGFLSLGKKFSDNDQRYGLHFEKVDTRIDQIELRLAKEYVDRQDLQGRLQCRKKGRRRQRHKQYNEQPRVWEASLERERGAP